MVYEKEKAIDVERSRIDVAVKNAYKSWSKDSTNVKLALKLNRTLDEAYGTGVKISVKIAKEALESPNIVNQPIFEKLKRLNPGIQDEVVINSILDIPWSTRIYRGIVTTAKNSGYLCLSVISETECNFLAFLKPGDIDSFTPIRP
jgi:hypothetical protein